MHRSRHLLAHAAWLLAAALTLAAGPALAAAGKVLFASGSVQVERGGTRPLAQGDSIEIGDVIVTGPGSRAQLLMADGAKLALRAGTRFRIDALTLPGAVTAPGQARATASEGSSAATLLKGGFRTVTGSVGKTNPQGYQVRTPVGVLGIRGTDYAAVFCSGDCSDAPGVRPGEAIRDGLYLGVYTTDGGGIVFTPDGGAPFTLNPGQFAFVPLRLPAPEPLQTPPPVIEGDGAGPLVLGTARGAGLPGSTPPAGGTPDDFSNRRAPADAPSRPADPQAPGGNPSLNQPIEGQGPNGPVDLTGGTTPPPGLQNLAFAASTLDPFGSGAGGAEQDGTLGTDGGGNVTAFDAQVFVNDVPTAGTIAIGTSSNANTGLDAASGLRWGRWSGGAAAVTSPLGGGPVSLAGQSLHWIVDAPRDVAGALPITGGANYQLVGATTPTDGLGNVGTVGAAALLADFTAQQLSFNVTVDIDGARWFGAGDTTFGQTGVGFTGALNGTISGNAPAAGDFAGFFVTPADGTPGAPAAGVSYRLGDARGDRDTVAGVLAFAGIGSQPPGPPPPERRDLGFAIGSVGQLVQFADVATNQPTDYLQDGNLNLVQFGAGFPGPVVVDPASYAIGSSAVVESDYDSLTLLRWGRWSGGQATATVAGQPNTIDLASRSLHWIVSANAATPPVMPITGTASYALVGGTSPTDSNGAVGTLGSATFQANFTTNTIDSTLALTTGQRDWTATGVGVIGAQLGLPAHQFGGSYTVGGTNNATGQAMTGTGGFSGFFVTPGDPTTPGVPGGAGLSYSLLDDADGTTVQGTAAFQAP